MRVVRTPEKLESAIRNGLVNPNDTIELTGLDVGTFNSLREFYSERYEVRGVTNFSIFANEPTTYILHIRRKNA